SPRAGWDPPAADRTAKTYGPLDKAFALQAGRAETATASATAGTGSAQRRHVPDGVAPASRRQAATVLAEASATRLPRNPNHGISAKPVAAAPRMAPIVFTAYASPTERSAPCPVPRSRVTKG